MERLHLTGEPANHIHAMLVGGGLMYVKNTEADAWIVGMAPDFALLGGHIDDDPTRYPVWVVIPRSAPDS